MCRIDHAQDDAIPVAFCRHCHPELNLTATKRATLDAADRAAFKAKSELDSKKRELMKARHKLDSITRKGEPPEGSVNEKIAKSMRKKIGRIEKELEHAN